MTLMSQSSSSQTIAPRTNTLAVIAFVAAFLQPIAAIITGHIALRQLKTSGEAGRDLAKAGLILGYAFAVLQIVLFAAFCVLYVLSTWHPPLNG
jgi:hypothetical protein